ncbi:MAG: RidA family protein [Planctomycetota bacterium]|nr:MAG: RidA family protein [Planctomycetota bacterium]
METIHSDAAPAAIGPYSQAVQAGDFLFSSGQIALDAHGQLVEGGVEVQTEQVLSNLEAVLGAAGLLKTDVVKCTVFLKNMDDFAAINEVYGQFFGQHKPARSTVEVARLPKDVLVEIDVVAHRA